MKTKSLTLVFVAAGIVALALIDVAYACPDLLECGNFTDYDKIRDCNYIMGQGFSEGDEQYLLCTLWDTSYGFDGYHAPDYDLDFDTEIEYGEINTSRFVLAGKILIFGLFNYVLVSLTKYSAVVRWLTAVS
jgi:hypothetical protein